MSGTVPSTMRQSLLNDPIQVVSATIMAVMTTALLNQLSVWFAPLLFVVCIGGMAAVLQARVKSETR